MSVSIRCQVLEVSSKPDWLARTERTRDLLPWADPYIAVLMQKLEDRYEAEEHRAAKSDPLAGEDEPWSPPADYDWQDDAFLPVSAPAFRGCWDADVYGGWPLLDDLKGHSDETTF